MRQAVWMGLAWSMVACSGTQKPEGLVRNMGSFVTYTANPVAYSGTDTFSWQNTADLATVQFTGTALTAGTVQVTITDPNGLIALNQRNDGGSFAPVPEVAGAIGEWAFQVEYTNATGAVAMTVTSKAKP